MAADALDAGKHTPGARPPGDAAKRPGEAREIGHRRHVSSLERVAERAAMPLRVAVSLP